MYGDTAVHVGGQGTVVTPSGPTVVAVTPVLENWADANVVKIARAATQRATMTPEERRERTKQIETRNECDVQ